MAKQDASTLPTLDDFTEVETMSGAPGFKQPEVTPTPEVELEKKKADEAATAEEARQKLAADEAAKLEAEKAKAGKPKPAGDKDKKKDLDAASTEALIKKAEETPETLTAEERQYLIEKNLFEETGSFWEDVEKEHGIKVEVDYGDVDPESAKGAALRDQAIIDMAAAKQMEYLQTTFPEVYQILEHVNNGGRVTDLINNETPDFSKVVLEKDDKESQKDLLLNFYKGKGFDDKRAARMVDADEDSAEGLLVAAQDALKQLQAAQTENQKEIIEAQKQQKAEIERRNLAFKQSIKQLTDAGKLGDFTITSPKDRNDFYQFAVNNIYADGRNGYQVVLPVNDEAALTSVMQQLFFGFKKGKLDEFVKREAQTQQVRKLQRRVSQSRPTVGGQEGEGATKLDQKNLPTFDVFNA